jgi:MFS family permease
MMAQNAIQKNNGRGTTATTAAVASTVLLILGAAQFLMILDTSVMNVSITTVAEDIGTTVAGIQTAITLFTLVMATLMITGGKIGTIYGRRRVFSIGLVIYACGSLTTALSPNLTVLLIGWSLLEGIGAALIMPAIVALVAGNVKEEERPRAYGLIAACGAIAVAVGPLIGGLCTTYFSWRWVFAGEVVIAIVILLMARRLAESPVEKKARLDLVGTLLTVIGLGAVVYGVLRSG